MPQIDVQDLYPAITQPDAADAASNWFSYCKNVYARQFGGEAGRMPSLREFQRDWRIYVRDRNFQIPGETYNDCKTWLINETGSAASISFFRRLSSGSAWYPYRRAMTVLVALNTAAALRRSFGERISWNVDFLTLADDSYRRSVNNRANVWQAKFHGRCVLPLGMTNWNQLSRHIEENQWDLFWARIFSIYEAQPFRRNLAAPQYQRAGYEHRRQVRSSQRNERRGSRPYRETLRRESAMIDTHTTSLMQEYVARSEDADTLISTRELGNMMANMEVELPEEFVRELFEIVRLSAMTEELTDADEGE